MKKRCFSSLLFFSPFFIRAQVGMNTKIPVTQLNLLMKKVSGLFMVFFFEIITAQVGINIASPNNSAILHVSSSNKGVLYPRMTEAQKLAIPNPAEGLLVYDTTSQCPYVYNSLEWTPLCNKATLESFSFGSASLSGSQLTNNTRILIGSYKFTTGKRSEEVRIEGSVDTQVPTGFTNDRVYYDIIETEFVNSSNVKIGEMCAVKQFFYPNSSSGGNVTGTNMTFHIGCSMIFSPNSQYTINIYAKTQSTTPYTGWTINGGNAQLIRKTL